MFRRIVATSAAIALSSALAVALPAAQASASSEVTVATGTVTGTTGQAVPGETVALYAWPSDEVLHALAPGQAVPWTELASTTTSSAGSYTLTVPSAALQAAAVESGWANLTIYTASGQWNFSYLTDPAVGQSYQQVTVNLTSGKKRPNCGTYTVDGNKEPYTFSGWSALRARPPANATVGQGYVIPSKKTQGDTLTFLYAEGSDNTQISNLGLGISAYGFSAGYTASGSKKSSVTDEEPMGTWTDSRLFETQFNVELYRGICYSLLNHHSHVHQHGKCPKRWKGSFFVHKCLWELGSTTWASGANVLRPKKTPSAGHCQFFHYNTGYDSDHGVAVTWSAGYQIGEADDVKGLNLTADFGASAQTGYDHNARMAFSFPVHSGWLCGTNHQPPRAAQMVARANKP
jgi:hypothetical protein